MARDTSPFPLLGEPLALDLVNTVIAGERGPVDLLDSPERWATWLRAQAARLPPPAAGGAADGVAPTLRPLPTEALALREALRALFDAALRGGTPPDGAVETVNEASAAGAPYAELTWPPGGPPQRRERYRAAGAGAPALAAIARSAIDLLAGPDRARLRRCEGPGCVLLFLAVNPRRRWCAPELCGNRVRVARHYRRHRPA